MKHDQIKSKVIGQASQMGSCQTKWESGLTDEGMLMSLEGSGTSNENS